MIAVSTVLVLLCGHTDTHTDRCNRCLVTVVLSAPFTNPLTYLLIDADERLTPATVVGVSNYITLFTYKANYNDWRKPCVLYFSEGHSSS